jgi:diadenosine tetraphosphate (Ap4A) HIT family hydrolase
MTYDTNNIFAKILRGEIPSNKIYEDDKVVAFHDIHPRKKVHVLILPKGPYADIQSFGEDADDEDIVALFRAVPKIATQLGIDKSGYRVITNCRTHGGQEVPHLHLHLLGGEAVGHMVS